MYFPWTLLTPKAAILHSCTQHQNLGRGPGASLLTAWWQAFRTVGQWVWLPHLGRIQKDGIRMLLMGRAVSRWKDWINRHVIVIKQDSWGFPVWPCTFPRPGLLFTDTGMVAVQGRKKAEHSTVLRTEKGAPLLCMEWLLSVRRWLLGERIARDGLLQLFFPYSEYVSLRFIF